MTRKILFTSFDTWLPHHKSNAADDLLEIISHHPALPKTATLLRKLPVDYHQAPQKVIAKINEIHPDFILCCGMAERREKLTLESCARQESEQLKTNADLKWLLADLSFTEISHDAGKFVCEALYYAVLKHLHHRHLHSHCVFLHVPILSQSNSHHIISDMVAIINKLKI